MIHLSVDNFILILVKGRAVEINKQIMQINIDNGKYGKGILMACIGVFLY